MSRRVDDWCRAMQARVDYLDQEREPLNESAPRNDRRYVRVRGAGQVIVALVDPAIAFPLRTRAVRQDPSPLAIDDVKYWFGSRHGREVPILDEHRDPAGTMRWRGITSTPEVDVRLGQDREAGGSRDPIRPGDLDALVAGACDFSGQAQRAQPLWAWFLTNLGP